MFCWNSAGEGVIRFPIKEKRSFPAAPAKFLRDGLENCVVSILPYFGGESLGLPGTGFEVSMNSPRNKFRAGLTYRSNKGLTLSGSLRYVDSFRVVDGPNYNGVVNTYTLVDVGLTYDFSGSATGLSLAISAQNVFDNRHREYIGVPTIGRLVTSRLTYTF